MNRFLLVGSKNMSLKSRDPQIKMSITLYKSELHACVNDIRITLLSSVP